MLMNTVGNGQWDIVGNRTTLFSKDIGNEHRWTIDFELTLRRRWTFYVMNLIFPIVLVSGVNCVVILLPVECGEKMSVSVTTFLTLAVLMTQIPEDIPTNSDSICYLAVYLIVEMTLGALSIVLSALQVECHHRVSLRCSRT
ncbi:neuronal acetylcholine receptor subunit alpha-7-like [Littorina saxatilis]|uniref:neuronal acetylcholine receptor subunit alpha-7-like n=1 Tax=Littorina saxatilis TaxID=31220 RepID=UPI0038B50A04